MELYFYEEHRYYGPKEGKIWSQMWARILQPRFNEMLKSLLVSRTLLKEHFFETTEGNVHTSAFPLCLTASDMMDVILQLFMQS